MTRRWAWLLLPALLIACWMWLFQYRFTPASAVRTVPGVKGAVVQTAAFPGGVALLLKDGARYHEYEACRRALLLWQPCGGTGFHLDHGEGPVAHSAHAKYIGDGLYRVVVTGVVREASIDRIVWGDQEQPVIGPGHYLFVRLSADRDLFQRVVAVSAKGEELYEWSHTTYYQWVEIQENEPDDPHPLELLAGMALRDLAASNTGREFIVQDHSMSLFLVGAAGKVELGEAPAIGVLATWLENDFGFAFARKSAADDTYEIVGVGHAGSNVLATTAGYPGAIQFVGQEVHFIDGEGWKAVTWSGSPVLKAPLFLGPRANQRAWCSWSETGPLCLGGYWDPTADASESLTVVRPGEPAAEVVAKGNHPILGAGALSADGSLVAASLGSRSARTGDLGRVVVAWLDQEGKPVKTKEFPLLARKLFFDAYGRLIAHVYPPDGSGTGSILILNIDDGSTSVLTEPPAGGYSISMAPDRMRLYILPATGGAIELPLATE